MTVIKYLNFHVWWWAMLDFLGHVFAKILSDQSLLSFSPPPNITPNEPDRLLPEKEMKEKKKGEKENPRSRNENRHHRWKLLNFSLFYSTFYFISY